MCEVPQALPHIIVCSIPHDRIPSGGASDRTLIHQ